MSVDKRQVATDALETLGSIITANEKRDAIHLAVEPARAGHALKAGWEVGFLPDGRMGICDKPVGIVDPFLKVIVNENDHFWCVIYPRRITSLRHVWSHPDFPEEGEPPASRTTTEEQKRNSEKWLREFVSHSDCPDYDTVIAAATGQHHLNDLDDGDHYSEFQAYDGETFLFFGGSDAHGDIPPEFWVHVENVTGQKIPQDRRAKYFTCSC